MNSEKRNTSPTRRLLGRDVKCVKSGRVGCIQSCVDDQNMGRVVTSIPEWGNMQTNKSIKMTTSPHALLQKIRDNLLK